MTPQSERVAGAALSDVPEAQLTLLRNGLRIMAVRALRDDDLAEDVVQEVLLRALRGVQPHVAADPVRLGAYVGGIARHVIADVIRARARRAAVLPAVPTTNASALDELVTAESMADVAYGMRQLRARDREILLASYYEDLSPAEIAERTGVPVVNVRKQKSRALERLRSVIASRISVKRE